MISLGVVSIQFSLGFFSRKIEIVILLFMWVNGY